MNSFINKYSYKCLLGPQSKFITEYDRFVTWKVGKKNHFTCFGNLIEDDLSSLNGPFNFHYVSNDNLTFLKENFKVNKTNLQSTCIDLENLNYIGRKYHGIRGAINKNSSKQLTVQSYFNNLQDVKDMIEIWSTEIGEKYFRDFSGKNYHFYKNNFHLDCSNTFIYDNEKLIAFATLTMPSENNQSSYVIGKALFNLYPGLSEYADHVAYLQAIENGIKIVNLGQSKGKIADYKNKFPNTYMVPHFDGNIELK